MLSTQVAGVVSSVEGTADVFNGIVIAGPSLTITPDYRKLAQFGLTPAGFQYQVQTYLEGNIVGEMLEKEQLTPIRMVFPNSRRTYRFRYFRLAGFSSRRKTESDQFPGNGDDQSGRCGNPASGPAIHGCGDGAAGKSGSWFRDEKYSVGNKCKNTFASGVPYHVRRFIC